LRLYLVQHAAAKTEAEDPQRGLTDEGRRTVERVAEFLASLGLAVERIEHSDKLRARQTAEILAARLQPAAGTQPVTGLAPNDDVELTCARLRSESKDLMLVGHLPHLSRLAARLLELEADRAVVRFQMGAVVALSRDDVGRWGVEWMLAPALLSRR